MGLGRGARLEASKADLGRRSRSCLVLLAVGALYYGSGELGLQLSLVRDAVTPLWPPTGVAVVAFLAFGPRVWPAVATAAFLVNAPITSGLWVAGAIAVGNTVAPLACAVLLRRVRFSPELRRLHDAMWLVVMALATMAISATVGSLALDASSSLGQNSLGDTWWVWWAGDAMGVLIVAPFLWALWPFRWVRPQLGRAMEAVGLFGLVAGLAWVGARLDGPGLFLVLPPLVWIAWRFHRRGASIAALAASVIVTLAAVDGVGPFVDRSLLEKMATLQLFNAALSFTSLFFAAAVTERQEVMERLYERQRSIAETLQASLLPHELPTMAGVALCARYTPARRETSIGGDWYDVFSVGRTTLGVVVGDIAGHGIAASAAMADLRAELRAYAIDGSPPDEVLSRLNRVVLELAPDVLATVLYARFDTIDRTIDVASAGHPLPLRVTPDGDASPLAGRIGPALGVTTTASFTTERHTLDVNDTVIAFTDGLVERRNRPLDQGTTLLSELTPTLPVELDSACDVILESLLGEEISDDVALLLLRPMSFLKEELEITSTTDPHEVASMRRVLRRWLADNGATNDEAADVLLAATEAHTNAILHAYDGGSGTVKIGMRAEPPNVVVTVRDFGHWRIRLAEHADGSGGRGIALMHALADTVLIASDSHGTEVRLTVPLGSSSALAD